MKKIMDNILYRIKENALSKKAGKGNRVLEYRNLKAIKTGLIFWTATPGQTEWLEAFSKGWEGVKFDKLCFVPAGVEIPETEDKVTLRNEDLGFWGKIRNDRLSALLNKEYDLLIDLNVSSAALINYVLTHTRAHCIAGWKKEGGIADIVVDGGNEPITFMNELSVLLADIKNV